LRAPKADGTPFAFSGRRQKNFEEVPMENA